MSTYYKLPMDHKMQKVVVPSTASLSLEELEAQGVTVQKIALGVSTKNTKHDDSAPLVGATYQDNVLHKNER